MLILNAEYVSPYLYVWIFSDKAETFDVYAKYSQKGEIRLYTSEHPEEQAGLKVKLEEKPDYVILKINGIVKASVEVPASPTQDLFYVAYAQLYNYEGYTMLTLEIPCVIKEDGGKEMELKYFTWSGSIGRGITYVRIPTQNGIMWPSIPIQNYQGGVRAYVAGFIDGKPVFCSEAIIGNPPSEIIISPPVSHYALDIWAKPEVKIEEGHYVGKLTLNIYSATEFEGTMKLGPHRGPISLRKGWNSLTFSISDSGMPNYLYLPANENVPIYIFDKEGKRVGEGWLIINEADKKTLREIEKQVGLKLSYSYDRKSGALCVKYSAKTEVPVSLYIVEKLGMKKLADLEAGPSESEYKVYITAKGPFILVAYAEYGGKWYPLASVSSAPKTLLYLLLGGMALGIGLMAVHKRL